MEAVDTNVLVRILVDDKLQLGQVKKAREFALKARQLFIPQMVQVELVWVLESVYEIEKAEILMILTHLQENEVFVLQNEKSFSTALHQFQIGNADFSDCLIWAECHEQGLKLTTFDKKFARLSQVSLLTGS